MMSLLISILASFIMSNPVVYDTGSTVKIESKQVCMDYTMFRTATEALVDRSILDSSLSVQDSLIRSLNKQIAVCSLQVVVKDSARDLCEKQLGLSSEITATVRDSAKVAAKAQFWSGFRWGGTALLGVEVVLLSAILWAIN